MVPPIMTHAYIEEHDIASRYGLNKLSADEQAAFEAHMVDCAECLDRVDMAKAMRDGLRRVAAADGTFAGAASRPGQPIQTAGWSGRYHSYWAHPSRLAAAVVLAIAIGAALAAALIVPMRRQIARGSAAVADWQRRYNEADRTARALQDRLTAAERALRERPATQASGSSVPVFSLSVVRGGQDSPPVQILLAASATFVVLTVELPRSVGFQAYRASLADAAGQMVWRNEALRPASPEALGVGLSADLLRPGEYVLTVEGVGDRTVPLGRYRFRVTPGR